jgi:hypothetical protein
LAGICGELLETPSAAEVVLLSGVLMDVPGRGGIHIHLANRIPLQLYGRVGHARWLLILVHQLRPTKKSLCPVRLGMLYIGFTRHNQAGISKLIIQKGLKA